MELRNSMKNRKHISGKPFIPRYLHKIPLTTQYSVLFAHKVAHVPGRIPWLVVTTITCKKGLFHHVFNTDEHEGKNYYQAVWLQFFLISPIKFQITDDKNPHVFPCLNKTSEKDHFSAPVTQLKVPPQTSNIYQPGFAAKPTGNFYRNKAEFKVFLCIPIILLLSTLLMIKKKKIKPLTLIKHTTNFPSKLISNLKE